MKPIFVTFTLKVFNLCLCIIFACSAANGQESPAKFQLSQLRIISSSGIRVDTSVNIIVTGESLKKGSLAISVTEGKDYTYTIPDISKFKLKDKTPDTVKFNFSVRRDKLDDRTIKFEVAAFDENDQKVPLTSGNTFTILLKPQSTPLRSSDTFESWFFAGTNFDFFDGVKAQEFFFRSNNLLHIYKDFYVQLAIYKNRYFTNDSTTRNYFAQSERIFPITTDSLYRVSSGTYRKDTRQTFDPLGWQVDVLYKVLRESSGQNEEVSKTIFVTGGFDFSTTTTTVQNTLSNFDSMTFVTKRPDTVGLTRSIPFPPSAYSYKTKSSNLNVGFMYVFDNKNINFKVHLTAGLSFYNKASIVSGSRGADGTYYQDFDNVYLQLRTFGTYKPLGISIGFEAFYRAGDFLGINTTLSKVFDLEDFTKILSPVNSLNMKK